MLKKNKTKKNKQTKQKHSLNQPQTLKVFSDQPLVGALVTGRVSELFY